MSHGLDYGDIRPEDSPPLIQHTPPLYAYSDRSLLIEATATCSTPECSAKLWYRQSDGGDLGELTEAPAWPIQAMRLVGTAPVAPAGFGTDLQADIAVGIRITPDSCLAKARLRIKQSAGEAGLRLPDPLLRAMAQGRG